MKDLCQRETNTNSLKRNKGIRKLTIMFPKLEERLKGHCLGSFTVLRSYLAEKPKLTT